MDNINKQGYIMKNKILRRLFTVIESILLLFGFVSLPLFLLANQKNGAEYLSYPVLMYHHILPEEDNKVFKENSCVLALSDFEEQMKYLYDNGFYAMTCADVIGLLYDFKAPPKKSVWLTFDDGYDSNFLYAYDVLKRYGFRATIFVISSYITEQRVPYNPDKLVYLCEEDMEKYADVFDYASHSDNLHYLNGNGQAALEFEDTAVIYDDTNAALSNENINIKTIYSYPYGKVGESAVEILKDSGIKAAVTVKWGYLNPFTDPHSIPRIDIYRGITYNKFKRIFYINK